MVSKLQKFNRGIAMALGLLSIAAGIPKILQMPQELGFLVSIGLTGIAVSALGVLQSAGGVMLFLSPTRLAGASLAALAFSVSSAAIFASGDAAFGLFSLVPLLVAVGVIYFELQGSGGSA